MGLAVSRFDFLIKEHHMSASSQEPNDATPQSCEACPLTVDRRVFLRAAALAAVGALVGGIETPAFAGRVASTRPRHSAGGERLYDVPLTDSVAIDEANDVILVRWQERAYALSSRCTHRGAALDWRADEGRVFCPKHKARFRPDGGHASGRATRDLDRFDIHRRGNALVVDLTALRRADRDPEAWQAAVVRLA
jgi:nitrite reductase/ring-hydroxylating ferredoxin subunit